MAIANEADRIANALVKALGDQALRHVETYVRHLEHQHDIGRLARWQLVAEALRRRSLLGGMNGTNHGVRNIQELTFQ